MAWNGSDEAMIEFEERHGLTFPSLRDDRGELFARFGVPAQPAWVFVTADGEIETYVGALPDDLLDEAFVRTALP